jgi:PhnB protein
MPKTKAIPEGCEGIIVHLVVDDAAKAIDFYTRAFGGQEIYRAAMPDGSKLMHAEMRIGKSVVYLADDFPEWSGKPRTPKALGGTPFNIHQYVTNTDAAIKRAADAGATITMEPADMFWGDRYGKVQDPFGHEWAFSTHLKDVTPEQMVAAAAEMFSNTSHG